MQSDYSPSQNHMEVKYLKYAPINKQHSKNNQGHQESEHRDRVQGSILTQLIGGEGYVERWYYSHTHLLETHNKDKHALHLLIVMIHVYIHLDDLWIHLPRSLGISKIITIT